MRKGWLALALAVTLLVPVSANATPLDSFTNGFDDLVNPKTNVEVEDPAESYQRDYEPQEVDLYSTREPVRALPENPTTNDYINNTVDSFNSVKIGSYNYSLLRGIQYMLGEYSGLGMPALLIAPAVGLVFVWWGVRKAKSIIWTAFRTGRLNLGTSVKRAWYRRKAKEWYG